MENKDRVSEILFSLVLVTYAVIAVIYVYHEFIIRVIVNFLLFGILFIILTVTWMIFFHIYQFRYYRGPEFQKIESDIKGYVQDCNELNEYIEELKDKHKDKIKSKQRVHLKQNVSVQHGYKYKKAAYQDYDLTEFDYCFKDKKVMDRVEHDPYKYVVRYFDVKEDDFLGTATERLNDFLETVEDMLNDFLSVEEGKSMLDKKFKSINESIQDKVPFLICKFGIKKFMDKLGCDKSNFEINYYPIISKFGTKKIMNKLGYNKFNFEKKYYPTCKFIYITDGKRKKKEYSIPLDVKHLEQFAHYLSKRIKFNNSIKGQRALMTPKLRDEIKERDNYTCQNELCGVSTHDEPTLLLEIDHKIPLSKGGLTTRDNLQTLCWRCNRSKGTKTSRMFMSQQKQLIMENEMFITENETLSEDEDRVITT